MVTRTNETCSVGRIAHGLSEAHAAVARARAVIAPGDPLAAPGDRLAASEPLVVAFGCLHNASVEIARDKDHPHRGVLADLRAAVDQLVMAVQSSERDAVSASDRLAQVALTIEAVARSTGVSLDATCSVVQARGRCDHHAIAATAVARHAPATLRSVLDDRVRPRHPLEATLTRKQIEKFDYGGGLAASDQAALARDARNALAAAFAPLVHDLVMCARQLREVPLDEMPLAGAEPVLSPNPSEPEFDQLRTKLGLGGDGELGRIEQSVASQLRTPTGKTGLGIDIRAPIGAYGEPLAYALVQAARAINARAFEYLDVAAGALGARHAELMTKWTTRSKHGSDPLTVTIEGINSCCNAVALLTARRVPGLDAAQLLDRIEADHGVERLAKGPSDVVGPLANHGYAPVDGLAARQDGQLRLGTTFRSVISSAREMRRVADCPTISTRGGCPLALKVEVELGSAASRSEETFVSLLLREYLHLVRRFYAAEPAGVRHA
jgi:hypothetical protein